VVCRTAFNPVITPELFNRAQARFANFTHNLTDEQLLERLSLVLARHGKLSAKIIDRSRSYPGTTTYYARFGGLLNLYRKLGHDAPNVSAQATMRQRHLLTRSGLINRLLEAFPGQLEEVRKSRRYRALLRYRKTGLLVAVVLAQYGRDAVGDYWRIDAPRVERKRPALVVILDDDNSTIRSLRIFRQLEFPILTVRAGKTDDWLRLGHPIADISEVVNVLKAIRSRREQTVMMANRAFG